MDFTPAEPRKNNRVKRRAAVLLAICACALTWAGCGSLGYYSQAVRGHWGVVSRTKKIERVLEESTTSDKLRHKLQLVLEARDFAERELGLEPKGHYLKYADLGRDSVVYNVYAAPEFSMDSHQWWYPFIGRQSYRGYFAKQDAVDCATELKAQGYDVYVGGVDAYSTLGFFKDPVLNTWINDDDEEVVALVFHELTHQRLYIDDDTSFNEAFATAVEIAGTRMWLQRKGLGKALREWEARQARRGKFVRLVKQARAELKQLYASEMPAGTDDTREQKEQTLQDFRRRLIELRAGWRSTNSYSSWLSKPVNNARLNTVSTYFDLVPAFLTLLERHESDFESFYVEVERIGEMKKEDRKGFLTALMTEKNATQAAGPVIEPREISTAAN